jgi:hypothetical protein
MRPLIAAALALAAGAAHAQYYYYSAPTYYAPPAYYAAPTYYPVQSYNSGPVFQSYPQYTTNYRTPYQPAMTPQQSWNVVRNVGSFMYSGPVRYIGGQAAFYGFVGRAY